MKEIKTIKINSKTFLVLKDAVKNSIEFENLTGKQLNITSTVGEVLAAKEFNLELVVNDINTDFDAIDKNKKKVQIKTRRLNSKKSTLLGKMLNKEDKINYDYALLVLLDKEYNLMKIYKVEKENILNHFKKINSNRNLNGKINRKTMSISQFKKLSK